MCINVVQGDMGYVVMCQCTLGVDRDLLVGDGDDGVGPMDSSVRL